jgi:hypothetical protein
MVVFALTRWPGLLPVNFSAAYALVFCAGVYFPRRLAWWLPLVTLAISDLALNCYYQFALGIDSFQAYQLMNYAAYAALLGLGRRFKPSASLLKLISGGVLGAFLFYLLTNTACWWFNPFKNPEYTKSLAGWFIALTKGTAGYPTTLEFLLRTLLSGGLFTGLFAGAMKLTATAESPADKEPQREPPPEEAEAPAPEESKV